jgi:Domain of unknown function (DUF4110)/Kelch motif/Galactose oxidase, central domain
MGRQKKKKNTADPAAQKEARAYSKELKRQSQQHFHTGDEQDDEHDESLDELQRQYLECETGSTDEILPRTHWQVLRRTEANKNLAAFPLPRAHATLTVAPLHNDKEELGLYLFGGEYHDGVNTVVLNELLRYHVSRQEWSRYRAPAGTALPPPRSAHTCVAHENALYVFGGERILYTKKRDNDDDDAAAAATISSYHHYKDIWKFDLTTNTWTLVTPNKSVGSHPSPRSGHAAAVYQDYMVVFGGFFDSASSGSKSVPAQWYNDVCVLHLPTETWLTLPHVKWTASARPEPRSACNVALLPSKSGSSSSLLVHGGFAKQPAVAANKQTVVMAASSNRSGRANGSAPAHLPTPEETLVHTDAWWLHLAPLPSSPPVWERVTSSVQRKMLQAAHGDYAPHGRAGTASVAVPDGVLSRDNEAAAATMLVFGGVTDTELYHHELRSVFYNDLYAFDTKKRKFFRVPVTGHATTGWDQNQLKSTMFAFLDGDGNLVYEKLSEANGHPNQPRPHEALEENQSSDEEEEEKEEHKSERLDKVPTPSRLISSSSVMVLNSQTKLPEPVPRTEPLPRMQARLAVIDRTLYVYGGLLEVGDREITLDDLWSLNLVDRQAWKCIFPGTMHQQVWRGSTADDEDSYYSSEQVNQEEEEEDGDDEEEPRKDVSKALPNSAVAPKGQEASAVPTKERKSSIKHEMKALTKQYGFENDSRTPRPNESLTDFFERTREYWQEAARGQTEVADQGFALARTRYNELEPVMTRMLELEAEYKKLKLSKS